MGSAPLAGWAVGPGAEHDALQHVKGSATPEDYLLSRERRTLVVPLEIGLVEALGAELLIHARHGAVDLVARAPVDSIGADTREVWVDGAASRIDLFDHEGRRIP